MRRPLLVPALLVLSAAFLSGCGDEEPEPQTAVDELAAHEGAVCPPELVDPGDDHGFGTDTPAESELDLPPADAAYVCRYAAVDNGPAERGGKRIGWRLEGEQEAVAEEDLARVDELLGQLEPAAEHRACTADLGPRWMLVHVAGSDTTGVVIDDFGCRDVRVTDDPFTLAPGEAGDGSGVLGGPDGIVAEVAGLVGGGVR